MSRPKKTFTLDERQLGLVLAALRLWQRTADNSRESTPELDIATDLGKFRVLTPDEIDLLIKRINVGDH